MSADKRRNLRRFIVATFLGAACLSAQAERADRDKPVNIEADKVEIDDQKKEAIFQGNVVLTQGTLMLKADRIVVNQDESGFQSGVAYGKPAYFRQKREGYEDFIEGEAERLEYHGQQEKVELFINAKLTRGGDEVRGNYISYSALTEFFEVMGEQPGTAPGTTGGRVRAIIQPRNEEEDGESTESQ
ncbi:MAG: lipopolysaccharide transport periplasmic protein LptA [Betaproteobacteria bacterium]|nr:MAG: lipopolysaccharide transport periplasmic protein LptA [Betaproteobacteria bacterium]